MISVKTFLNMYCKYRVFNLGNRVEYGNGYLSIFRDLLLITEYR